MDIPEDFFTNLQRTIDSGETPAGITLRNLPPAYRANIDELLNTTARAISKGPGHPMREFTPFELEHLRRSIPILGFPYHRFITQGPYAGLVYSFKRSVPLTGFKTSANGGKITQIYHPSIRAGVWVTSTEVLAGRWPRGLCFESPSSRSAEETDRELDQLAGGPDRWRVMSEVLQPDYAMTDQGRVYRIRPWKNGRDVNPATGERIPYEIRPYLVNGSYQVGLPPTARDEDGLALKAVRIYLRRLYAVVWGEGANPVLAANFHGTTPCNPHADVVEAFTPGKRGRPPGSGTTQPGTEPAPDPGEPETVSI
jgi:hypothetical protein